MNSIYNRTLFRLLLVTIILLASGACNTARKNTSDYTVGVTFQNLQNEFIINIQNAMRSEAESLNVHLIDVDGQGKAENQISQVENFIAMDVDAIILNPYDEFGSSSVVSIAKREGKPIIVVNAVVVNLEEADAYVGSNDIEAGEIAATHIANLLGGKGNIALIRGPLGHSAEVQRTEGIMRVLSSYPDMHVIFDQTGEWDRAKGLELMENWISTGEKINAVISQNDEMALGAQKAIEASGLQNDILVIGIDAIPDALRAVKEGKLCGTVFQDARKQGEKALELAIRLLQGDSIQHTYYIPFKLVTKDNIDQFK